MSYLQLTNRAKANLDGAINNSVTTLDVAEGYGALFPDENFIITIEDERILVGTRTTDTFSDLTRGYDDTDAAEHADTTEVSLNIVAKHFEEMQDALEINGQINLKEYTYGESIAVNDALYLKNADSKVYKASHDADGESTYNFVGFAKEAGAADYVGQVQIGGLVTGFTGLTTGKQYLTATAGETSHTEPNWDDAHITFGEVGHAISATEIQLPIFKRFVVTFNDPHCQFTWRKSPRLKYVDVELVGAGGGGGFAPSGGGGQYKGSGGGGGGYCRKRYHAIELSASEIVRIGRGGAGGTSAGTSGEDGEDTTFESMTAGKGEGGVYNSEGGPGGVSTGGDINVNGGQGRYGPACAFGGTGGGTVLGGQAAGVNNSSNAGVPYGGGAAGGKTQAGGSSTNGGKGAPGVAILVEYY